MKSLLTLCSENWSTTAHMTDTNTTELSVPESTTRKSSRNMFLVISGDSHCSVSFNCFWYWSRTFKSRTDFCLFWQGFSVYASVSNLLFRQCGLRQVWISCLLKRWQTNEWTWTWVLDSLLCFSCFSLDLCRGLNSSGLHGGEHLTAVQLLWS